MTPLLEARGITVSYGKIEAVRSVDLVVAPGSIVSVIGPNGAGKTSLLKGLMGVLPCAGEILFGGVSVRDSMLEDRVDAGLSLVPEERALFGQMTVLENLVLGGFVRRRAAEAVRRAALDEVYGLFPRLAERAGQRADTLSGGERQMLALGRALLARPRLLMLDEPSLGLAPRIVGEIFRTLKALRERGVSLLVVEQNARAALSIADSAYVIERGAVVLSGAAADLAGDPRVIATYLGQDAMAASAASGRSVSIASSPE